MFPYITYLVVQVKMQMCKVQASKYCDKLTSTFPYPAEKQACHSGEVPSPNPTEKQAAATQVRYLQVRYLQVRYIPLPSREAGLPFR